MWDTSKQPPQPQHGQQMPIPAQVYGEPGPSAPQYYTSPPAPQYHTSPPAPPQYNITVTTAPQYPAGQPVPPIQNEGFLKNNQKNKPQSNSVGAASFIFISGGMNMAWGLGLSSSITIVASDHVLASWFIGGIIGALVGAFVCNRVPKKFIVLFASVLVTICGILQVFDSNSLDSILASRYLDGIAVGIIFPMTFALLGEQLVPSIRGVNAASVDTMCFSCGIFIQIVYSVWWNVGYNISFKSMQMCGILNMVYGIISFVMGAMLIIESPVLYLARDDEQNAIDTLRRLQRPLTITPETYHLLEESKRYLAKSEDKTFLQNALYGLPALLKLCFYRSLMALGFTYFVNFTFTYTSLLTTQLYVYPYILYGLARWLGPLFVTFTLDSKGRKMPMLVGICFFAILAFVVGGICNTKTNLVSFEYMNVVKYVLIIFQLFGSLSMASSSVYMSEAFPFPVKPYYVAIVFIVEMLVHIIIICCRGNYLKILLDSPDYFITVGVLSLAFLGMAVVALPETKKLTLRECLSKMRRLNNFQN